MGRCTNRATVSNTILYLHVFDWSTYGKLMVPGLKSPVQRTWMLAGGAAQAFTRKTP
jgi:hypothetical protein